jgi:hypothetical protein
MGALVPLNPADDKPRRLILTKAEKEAFSVSPELKEIFIGLLLGDLYAQKRSLNTRFRRR